MSQMTSKRPGFMPLREALRRRALACALAVSVLPMVAVLPALGDGMSEIDAGRVAAAAGNLEEALDHFNQAIKSGDLSDNDLALAYNNRGNVHAAMGNPKRSLQDLNRAILIDPKYINAYYNRAITYQDLGELEKAIKDYSEVMRLNPNHLAATFYRGLINEKLGRHEAAEKDFLKAYELEPENLTVKSKLQAMGLIEADPPE